MSLINIFILGLIICHLPHGPTAYFTISDLVMRHDIPNIGNMSEAYPNLVFHNFKTRLGERVSYGQSEHGAQGIKLPLCLLITNTITYFCRLCPY